MKKPIEDMQGRDGDDVARQVDGMIEAGMVLFGAMIVVALVAAWL